MSEIFNFHRFGTYFLYDLRQMWRKHSRAAMLIGGSVAILYVVWVLCSLVFTQHWSAPMIEVRFMLLMVAFTVLELYQARTYGYLTDKMEGSDWLMVPASRTEKFVSMLLMTLVVIPLLFLFVYFLLDGFLSLVDPTYGKALITGFWGTYHGMINMFGQMSESSPIAFSTGALVFAFIIGYICNFLYFLLCGVFFKNHKIVWGIAIMCGFSMVLSILFGLLVPILMLKMPHFEMDELQAAHLVVGLMNGTLVFCCLLALGLGWGIWRRVKTLQH